MDFSSYAECRISPLAQRIFRLPGVTRVFLGPDFIAVNKEDETAWADLKPSIFAVIMEVYTAGEAIVLDDESQMDPNMIREDDSEVVQMVKELLETRIRPTVMEDGGDIVFKGFDEATGIVYLKLLGSCQGCPSSSVTLKNGVENMLMHYIPDVTAVEEFPDGEQLVQDKQFEQVAARADASAAQD